MIAAISPTPTTLIDALAIIGLCIPAALFLHAIVSVSMVRKARSADPSAAEALKKHLWSAPSLLLAWLPFLAMALALIGCSLLRDAGYLTFPWPMIGVWVLFALLRGLYEMMLRRRLKRLMGNVALW